MVKMEPVKWYRITWTLQDDPCKKYFQLLIVNPILLVPPTKYLRQGISKFLRALLKDLPITLQLPVYFSCALYPGIKF
ncbi:chloride channel CLIC-like protein 1 [Clarias gariepinus]